MGIPFLNEIITLFLLAIVVSTACARLRLPVTVGYLLTGILCGPFVLGIVSDPHSVDVLAEIGVALLLFTIGMELSGEALSRLKKPVFVGGSLQIALAILVMTTFTVALGQKLSIGIFAGCLLALSSTAIVLRLFQEKGLTHTPQGRLALAILVLQDILFAPMLVIVPLLAGAVAFSTITVLTAVGQITAVLGGVLLFARFGLNPLMAAVVRTRVRELLLLTTLGLCMGLALLTASLGLSLSLGAFLAGLLLARSEYSMNVIAGVLPYRDVFMSLFFISVGMLLNVEYAWEHIIPLLLTTPLAIVLKALLILPAVLVQGYPLRTALLVALPLAQIGEFSFVLAAKGLQTGLLDPLTYQYFLALSIFTMMLTPGLLSIAPRLATAVTRILGKKIHTHEPHDTASTHENHLIIVGFGVSGKHLAEAAKEAGIPYEILEMNPDTVMRFRPTQPIHFGDASQPAVLEHLGIHSAKVLAIVISDPAAVRATIAEARALNPALFIIARSRFLSEVKPLRNLGANAVVAEEFESSMEVFSRVLYQYLVPKQDIDAFAARIRSENYRMLRGNTSANTLEALVRHMPNMTLQGLRMEDGAPLAGKTLAQSGLRNEYGATVIALMRRDIMYPSPDPEMPLRAGDILYLFASPDRVQGALSLFREVSASKQDKKTQH